MQVAFRLINNLQTNYETTFQMDFLHETVPMIPNRASLSLSWMAIIAQSVPTSMRKTPNLEVLRMNTTRKPSNTAGFEKSKG